jgi:biopolymer transport protein ExbD
MRGSYGVVVALSLVAAACGDREREAFDERLAQMRRESATLAHTAAPTPWDGAQTTLPSPSTRIVATLDGVFVDDTRPFAVRFAREGERFFAGARDGGLGALLPGGVRRVSNLAAGRAADPAELRRAVQNALPAALAGADVPIALHVDPRVMFEAVEALVGALGARGYEHVELMFRAPTGPRVLAATFRGVRWSSQSHAVLELALLLRYQGITVAGSGGAIAPGCANTTHLSTVNTAPRAGAGYDLGALRACLRRIKDEPDFADETEVRVFADRRVPWGHVAEVMGAVQRDERGLLFPGLLLVAD